MPFAKTELLFCSSEFNVSNDFWAKLMTKQTAAIWVWNGVKSTVDPCSKLIRVKGRLDPFLFNPDPFLFNPDPFLILFNPVRAEMVTDPGEYRWSSYQINAHGKVSDLCTPHPEYLALGIEPLERRENYRALFVHHVDDELLEEIRTNTNKGMAVGNDRFKEEIETLTGRRLRAKKRGRPSGWRKVKV